MDFFKSLEKKASETYQKTKEKVTTVSGELKAKGKISDYNLEIEELYMEIGKKVFEEVKDGKDVIIEEIAEKIEKITKLQEKIEKTQIEILNLKKMKRCINCGAEINVDDGFCSYCGTRQIKKQENVEVHDNSNPQAQEAEVIEVKDIENAANTEQVENAENIANTEQTENIENIANTEPKENTENIVGTEQEKNKE